MSIFSPVVDLRFKEMADFFFSFFQKIGHRQETGWVASQLAKEPSSASCFLTADGL